MHGVAIRDRIARLERNPSRAEALKRARSRLSKAFNSAQGQPTLTSLRLAAGLSQSQLAERIGTQQSNVSRWERDPSDMRASTVTKLASVFGVGPALVLDAISRVEGECEV